MKNATVNVKFPIEIFAHFPTGNIGLSVWTVKVHKY